MKTFAILLAIAVVYIAFADAIFSKQAFGTCKYSRGGGIVTGPCPLGSRARCCMGRRQDQAQGLTGPFIPLCKVCTDTRRQGRPNQPIEPVRPLQPGEGEAVIFS